MRRAALTLVLLAGIAAAAEDPAGQLDQPGRTPLLAPQQDRGPSRLPAGNPLGPPTIPHRITGYQQDLAFNRCLACHGDDAPEALGATPLPTSHRIDRSGAMREPYAKARYPCTTCHVPQARTGG